LGISFCAEATAQTYCLERQKTEILLMCILVALGSAILKELKVLKALIHKKSFKFKTTTKSLEFLG